MRRSHVTKKSAEILEHAAELILETGKREVDIAELAKRAGVSRPSIHALFGRGEDLSTKTVIFRRINDAFLENARATIEAVLASLPRTLSPMDRLVSVFHATLNTFKNNATFGRVVLQELNLSNDEENAAVFQIFAQVDQIISDARGQLNERADELKDFEIRHIIFTSTRGLLRAHYLQECFPIEDGKPRRDKCGLDLRHIEIEVLRILQLYCNLDTQQKIEDAIKLVKVEATVKAKKPSLKIKKSKSTR